ncbi:hypothetical protein Tco_0562362 [Tanacetum coccineum]
MEIVFQLLAVPVVNALKEKFVSFKICHVEKKKVPGLQDAEVLIEKLIEKKEEVLGQNRWHDVKLRAFDNAKHRTYVDLLIGRPVGSIKLDESGSQICDVNMWCKYIIDAQTHHFDIV